MIRSDLIPIAVDPTLTIQGASTTFDTFVANGSAYQSSDLHLNASLFTGTDSTYGITRSLVQFQLSPLLSGAQIQSANLTLNQYLTSTNTEAVDVYPITFTWTSSTATWNNAPAIGTKLSTTNVTAAGAYNFDVTSLAKDWYNGVKSNISND